MQNLTNKEIEQSEQVNSFFEIWHRILGKMSISLEEYRLIFNTYKNLNENGKLSPELKQIFYIALLDPNVNIKNEDINGIFEIIKYRNAVLDINQSFDESVSR